MGSFLSCLQALPHVVHSKQIYKISPWWREKPSLVPCLFTEIDPRVCQLKYSVAVIIINNYYLLRWSIKEVWLLEALHMI